MVISKFSRLFFTILFFVSAISANVKNPVTFDVRTYGARGDGTTDNTKAFMKAWDEACRYNGKARVYVPVGTYMLGAVTFVGQCKGAISFVLKGTLKAPKDPFSIEQDAWIVFRYVDRLALTGGGTLDGQGEFAWPHNDCHKNPKCAAMPINIGFQFVMNATVKHIYSINSKMGHFSFFACRNVNLTDISISAPGDSPNTDGIKIGNSDNIRITRTNIGTGDDCVAILSGNTNIEISEVNCGPGHGISVGSLGRYAGEKNVMGFTVRDSTFNQTSDGVRIKTWASSVSKITVSKFVFQNLHMFDVGNPVIIDQKYCPHPPCQQESDSHVQIRDVTYDNIWGSSVSKVAVNLQCSKSFPCRDIKLKNINLIHKGPDGAASSQCSHVVGETYGKQNPPACVGRS